MLQWTDIVCCETYAVGLQDMYVYRSQLNMSPKNKQKLLNNMLINIQIGRTSNKFIMLNENLKKLQILSSR